VNSKVARARAHSLSLYIYLQRVILELVCVTQNRLWAISKIKLDFVNFSVYKASLDEEVLLAETSLTGRNFLNIQQECLLMCSERRTVKLYACQNMSEPCHTALQAAGLC